MADKFVWPVWAKNLRGQLYDMADALLKKEAVVFQEYVVTPEQYGYDGKGKATDSIQAAIDAAAEKGGGIVLLQKGDYISGTIELRSNIRLEVAKEARLLGSAELEDYPEHIAKRRTVMDTHMGMHQSLIFAEGCENIAICGQGVIDGRGTLENFYGDETIAATPGRPFLLRILDCKNIHIKDITLKDAACWMQNYLNCDNLVIEHIYVENQANYNNDGIDIDGCRNVLVKKCYVSSGDDALCLKSASQKMCENIFVEQCEFYSSCNAIKIGTDTQGDFRNILIQNCKACGVTEDMRRIKEIGADSGISLEMVDGAILENVLIRNIKVNHTRSPLFMRLDDRGRVKPEDEKPPLGIIRNIIIENVSGDECGPRGSYFLGIPERCIENVILFNISLCQKVTEREIVKEEEIGEMRGWYPDSQMIKLMGDAPAYALWMRHVKNLILVDYHVTTEGKEKRPAFVAETDAEFYKFYLEENQRK